MLETVLISFFVTVISGVILLVVEYRTNWVTNRISSLTKKDLLKPIQTNKLEVSLSRTKWVFGTLIFSIPITALIMTLLSNATISNLEQQIKIYEQYSDWNLPETLESLHNISQELDITLEERNKLSKYDELIEEISALKKDNEKLQGQLANFVFESNNIIVPVGEVVTLVDGYHFLSVESISSSYVSIYFQNRSEIIHLGEYERLLDYSLGLDCKLFLTKINAEQSAEFKFICDKAQ